MQPLPREFTLMMEEMLGGEAAAFFAALEEAPTLALRVNPLKARAAEAAREFAAEGVAWEERGFYLRPGLRPGASIAHTAGSFYLQEASAMLSVAALNPQPGERILDLCAAPGGKTTQIAGRMGGSGLLISSEPEPGRAKILAANLERTGVQNAVAVNAYPDALAARWSGYFDALLCDAPCSGEGMFRREPDSRLEWKPGAPAGCAKRQAEILDRAAELLRPGGRLVYSTCTFNPLENEQTISAFLSRHPDFSPEDFVLPQLGASQNGCMRIWPHRFPGDGHFCARLRRSGDERPAAPQYTNSRDDLSLLRALEAEICRLPAALAARLVRMGDYLYALPPECPDLKGLRLARAGVCLLRVGRNYIEPQHALAMALEPDFALRRADLTDEQAARYLAGEALEIDVPRGWNLVCWRGLPLGWGKASSGQLKNHLPKGLRR